MLQPEQKEFLMLWILLLTANPQNGPYSPVIRDQATIFSNVTGGVQTKLNNPNWNWTHLQEPNARAAIQQAVTTQGQNGAYNEVATDFLFLLNANATWPSGPVHPSVDELVDALGITA